MEELFRIFGQIRLKKGEGRTLKAGGAWVYDNEIVNNIYKKITIKFISFAVK